MIRLWLVVGVIAALFYIYSIVDCVLADRARVRGVPKAVWVPVVVVFGVIGGILWFAIGRPRKERAGRGRGTAPDDNPSFLRHLDEDRHQQERIRQIERELADLEKPEPPDDERNQPHKQKKSGDPDGRTDA